jgi:hypothetical protein
LPREWRRAAGQPLRPDDFYAFFSPPRTVYSPFLRRDPYSSSVVLPSGGTLESMMSIFSFLVFSAARPRLPATERFELVSVVVASRDALHARKALLGCPGASVLRCLPMRLSGSVTLEIRFPAGQGDAVMGRIRASLPGAEIGGVVACAIPCTKPRRAHFNLVRSHGF